MSKTAIGIILQGVSENPIYKHILLSKIKAFSSSARKRYEDILNNNVPIHLVDTKDAITLYSLYFNLDENAPNILDFFTQEDQEKYAFETPVMSEEEIYKSLFRGRMVYNPEVKSKFIFAYQTKLDFRTISNFINKLSGAGVANIEINNSKDICQFDNDKFFKDLLSGKSKGSFDTLKSFYLSYIDWCIENGFGSEISRSILKKLQYVDIGNFKSKTGGGHEYIQNSEELISIISKSYENHLDTSWEIISIPAVCLAWEGFHISEILEIAVENINVKLNQVTYKDKAVFINTKLFAYISKSLNDYERESKYLMDVPTTTNQSAERYVYNVVSRYNKFLQEYNLTKKPITIARLISAGRNFRLHEYEKEHGVVQWDKNTFGLLREVCRDHTMTSSACARKIEEYKVWKQNQQG